MSSFTRNNYLKLICAFSNKKSPQKGSAICRIVICMKEDKVLRAKAKIYNAL